MRKSKAEYQVYRSGSNGGISVEGSVLNEMSEIVSNYYPLVHENKQIINDHLAGSNSLVVARENHKITGFSSASVIKQKTPFCRYRVPVIFQRMLYIHPGILYRGIGPALLRETFVQLLGPFWFLRGFVLICRTQNPVVVKMMTRFTDYYPRENESLPADIRNFAESFLTILHATELDEKCCLTGSLSAYTDMDYTKIWNDVLHRSKNRFDDLILSSTFRREGDRIINSGAFLLLIGYSRPLNFIKVAFFLKKREE